MADNPYQSPESAQQPKAKRELTKWSWWKFAGAASLIPISCLMWLAGMEWGIFNPEPVATLSLIASPFVFFGGVILMLALVVRRVWRKKTG
jgi:hypothetical protein